jgi:peptidoglycan L-alanyl-D-glutamate endopeptidase CwlK
LGKPPRDRLPGAHPDLVRVVERAIQITTQDFRVQEGPRTRECQAELVARGASRTMHSLAQLGSTCT